MNWVSRFVRWLAGGHDARYHRLASEQTARNLDAELRARRAEKLHQDALALRLEVRSRGEHS
jgi:hypothetical protein